MADDYVCTLDEKTLQKAIRELNENPADRMNAIRAFRNLIQTRCPHIKCSLDASFLIRFLRVSKWSQLAALKRLENYLDLFNIAPEWLRDIDMTDPKIIAFLRTGYHLHIGPDDDGLPWSLQRMAVLDPKSTDYDKNSVMKAMMGGAIFGMSREDVQVHGASSIGDLTNFSMIHSNYWSLEDMKKSGKFWNNALPLRFKGLHYYNHGSVFEALMTVAKPFLSEKMKNRMFLHGNNLEAIYDKVIAKKFLPIEYLPDDYTGPSAGTIPELIEKEIAMMTDPKVVAQIKYETSNAFQLDNSKRPKDDVPLASFRKLNVD